MKFLIAFCVFVAAVAALPTPEEVTRDKRGLLLASPGATILSPAPALLAPRLVASPHLIHPQLVASPHLVHPQLVASSRLIASPWALNGGLVSPLALHGGLVNPLGQRIIVG